NRPCGHAPGLLAGPSRPASPPRFLAGGVGALPTSRGFLPTVRLALKPLARFLLPAFGLCLITRPLFVALECFFVILPTPQWRLRIFALAFASFMCSTFGTTHFGRVNGGGGGGGGGGV